MWLEMQVQGWKDTIKSHKDLLEENERAPFIRKARAPPFMSR